MNQFWLSERVALVTGGNRGLGRAMALALQEAGAKVVVTGRDRERNAAVAAELADGDAAVHEVDVRDEAALARTVTAIVARLGRLDILLNNAGMVHDGLTTDNRREDWEAVIATELTRPFCRPRRGRASSTSARPTQSSARPVTPPRKRARSDSPEGWQSNSRPRSKPTPTSRGAEDRTSPLPSVSLTEVRAAELPEVAECLRARA